MALIHVSKDPPNQRTVTPAYEHLWVTTIKNPFTFKLLYFRNNLKFGILSREEDLGQDWQLGLPLRLQARPGTLGQRILKETAIMRRRKKTKYVHEGQYVAEVDVDLIEDEGEWSPYLSIEDAYKLDDVRDALRRGDLVSASQYGRIFELRRVAQQ